jgi:hypothetical protein
MNDEHCLIRLGKRAFDFQTTLDLSYRISDVLGNTALSSSDNTMLASDALEELKVCRGIYSSPCIKRDSGCISLAHRIVSAH